MIGAVTLKTVPEDQLPHLELAREIARRFNHLYRKVFKEAEAILTKTPKVPGTDGRKMSKSYANTIDLSDSPETVDKKVMQMVTDPARKRREDKGHPEVCPVYFFHMVFIGKVKLKYIIVVQFLYLIKLFVEAKNLYGVYQRIHFR